MNSQTLYDTLNNLVKYILPAIGTAYFGLATIWNFPNGEQVVGTVAVVTTLLGVIVATMKSSFTKDNTIVAIPSEALPQNTAAGSVVDPDRVYFRDFDTQNGVDEEPLGYADIEETNEIAGPVDPNLLKDETKPKNPPRQGSDYVPEHGA